MSDSDAIDTRRGGAGVETEASERGAAEGIKLRWHFAVPIYDKLFPRFLPRREAIVRKILAMREADARGVVRSNRGGWHSTDQLHLSQDPDLAWLMQAICNVSTACIEDFEKGREHGEIAMVSAWANVNERGDWNLPHVHLPLDWSGVFYVQVDERPSEGADGDLLFLDPLPLGERWRREATIRYKPRNGLMVLFPAFLAHMVAPHRDEEQRISIAFNLKVRPKIDVESAR